MVVGLPQISWLEPAGYPEVIALFDDEFIRSRGRSISFVQRFEDVFAGDCLVAAATTAQRIVSALVIHPFLWIEGKREWRGAMVGLVYTDPQHRGKGYAARLLASAEQRCRELGCEFAVLWAADTRLYQRLGWISADRGVLGTGGGHGSDVPLDAATAAAPAVERIHALREERGGSRVKRTPAAYRRLLPPAERMRFYPEGCSYAVVGERGHTGYIYELAADAAGMPRLWDRVSRCYCDLYVNVEQDCFEHRWLQQHTPLQWHKQRLAMWKSLQPVAPMFEQWYIPFLDRV